MHAPAWHVSVCVHEFPSLQGVPLELAWSAGQVALAPVHVSAASHAPADGRQTAPAFPAACWQPSAWLHVSTVHEFPSSHSAAVWQTAIVRVHAGPRLNAIGRPSSSTREEAVGASIEISNVLPAVASSDVDRL